MCHRLQLPRAAYSSIPYVKILTCTLFIWHFLAISGRICLAHRLVTALKRRLYLGGKGKENSSNKFASKLWRVDAYNSYDIGGFGRLFP